MKILQQSRRVPVSRYSLCFAWRDDPEAGFSFPCTAHGEVITAEMGPVGQENYEKCLNGTYDVIAQGVRDESYSYLQHAVGQCSCGKTVELADFTNTCQCGLEYNSCGQLLASREQWEDTIDADPGVVAGVDDLSIYI